ncbi:unnamed protein product [Mytilus coruscus]|uniref:Antistasin-like domain-containing protein n=1 Tax=Mytilus coruscus TaxID=42192 RepID=A0A6J8B5S3_MYTCO|nr:unnamed protein product [Mytilus coruscus]
MTPSGCKCDCAHHFDPSNPGNSFNGGNKTPKPNISGGSCNTAWRNCQQPCATKSNPVSGCIECSCPTDQTTTPAAEMSTRSTENHSTIHLNSQQSSTTTKPTSMPETQKLVTYTQTVKPTTEAPQPLVQSTDISTRRTDNTEIRFPDVFTTPHVPEPEVTSYQTTKGTTLHMIVCAEVFDCDLDCYTGYSTDDSGCPLCKCAPLPTGFVSAYGPCPNPPRCAPGCFKLDERGCLLCACGVLNFHPGGYHGMPQLHMGGGGFVPGQMSRGGMFGGHKAQTQTQAKPLSQCPGTKLCMQTCKGKYSLGNVDRNGCKTCTCHTTHVSTHHSSNKPTPAPTKAPAKMSCMSTVMCMLTCKNGYQLGATKTDGCQECACVVPQVVKMEVTCASKLTCSSGCNVGYKCGTDGCPTCGCIKPQVVGLKVVEVVQKQVTCTSSFSCPSKCSLGYKCGTDGCPTCECLVAVHTDECNDCSNVNSGSNHVYITQTTNQCHDCHNTQTSTTNQIATHNTGSCTDCSNGGGSANTALTSGTKPGQTSSGGFQSPFTPGSGGMGNGQGLTTNSGQIGGTITGQSPFNTNGGGMTTAGGGMTNTGTGYSQSQGQHGSYLMGTGGENMAQGTLQQSNTGSGLSQSGLGTGTVSQSLGNIMGNQGPAAGINTTGTGPFVASGYGFFGNEGFKQSPYSQASGGNTEKGPFAQAGGNSGKSPFAQAGGNTNGQTSSNSGGAQGPFSSLQNGQGSVTSSGQGPSTGGHQGPFNSGQNSQVANSGGGQGPFSSMQNGQGPSTGGNQGPFSSTQNGKGPTTGGGQGPFSSMQNGQGPSTGGNQGPFSSMQNGKGPTTGGGQGPINSMQGGSNGLAGLQGKGNVDVSHIIKNCPETMHCMGQCPMGYQLAEADENGCPKCSCLTGKGETMQGLPHQNQINGQGQLGKGSGPFSSGGQQTAGSQQPSGTQHTSSTQTTGTQQTTGAHQTSGAQQITGAQQTSTDKNNAHKSSVLSCPTTFYCPHECSIGYIPGPDGCPSCDCAGGYKQKPVIVTEPLKQPSKTETVTLLKQCPATFNCMTSCKEGYTLGSADRDGCPACTCATVQKQTCNDCHHTSRSCDATISCMATCEHGYILGDKDNTGCPSCQCQACSTCEETKPQVVLVQQQKETCNNCEKVQVVQQVKEECHECGTTGGTGLMTGSTSGGGSGGGMTGGSGSGMMGGGSGMMGGGGGGGAMGGGMSSGGGGSAGMTGGSECHPLPPDCHPSCIKYDVAHCRICECTSSKYIAGMTDFIEFTK